MEEMSRWTDSYSHGTLIDFDFVKHLKLREQVQQICAERGWDYDEIQGDLGLFNQAARRRVAGLGIPCRAARAEDHRHQ